MEAGMDERLITEYLLGSLPENETERLDRLSLTDEEFAGQVDAVEHDLVDSFVRGELSEERLARFQSYYLASPRRREKVQFAKTLIDAIDKSSNVPAQTTGAPLRKSIFRQWGFAAAALVMLCATGYFIFENNRLRNQMILRQPDAALQQREQELQRQLAKQQSLTLQKEDELARARKNLAELEQKTQIPQPGSTPGQREVIVLAFNLSPQKRGISKLPQLVVPAGTAIIAFNLELEVNDFTEYRVALRNPATTKILWESGKIKVAGNSNVVHLRMPASVLKNQNYVLELLGLSPGNQAEVVGSYSFRVMSE